MASLTLRHERSGVVNTLADTLIERVDNLVQANKPRVGWGNPKLSTTPTSVAIAALAAQIEALEQAVREIALEVERLSTPTR
jgi:predicted sugar kinase